MAAYTSSGSGNWNNAATWGGAGTPGTGDTATILNTHTVTMVQNEECLSVDIQAGGTLKIDAAGNSQDIYLTFDDAASNGLLASAGHLWCVGDADYHCYLTLSGGSGASEMWDFNCNDISVTADYTTFEYFVKTDFQTGTFAINHCAFQHTRDAPGDKMVWFDGCTVNSFDDNTLDDGGYDAMFRSTVANLTVTNLVCTNPGGTITVFASNNCELHCVTSTFDLTTCNLGTGDSLITSEDHAGVAGYYGIVLRDADTVAYSQIDTEPDATDIIYVFLELGATSSTFNFDEAGKVCGGFVVRSGEAVTMECTAGTTFKGDLTNLYIWNTTANTSVDATTATGAGANISITFQSNANAAIRNSANGLQFNGDFDYYVRMYEAGVSPTAAPVNGIGITDLNQFTAGLNVRLYHIRNETAMSQFLSDTVNLDECLVMFDVSSEPGEVRPGASALISLDRVKIETYDNKQWYIVPTSVADASAAFTTRWCVFNNLIPSVWEEANTDEGVVLWDMPRVARPVYPSIAMASQASEYVGGDSVPVERTHVSNIMVKFEGDFVHGTDDPWGWANGHPMGHDYQFQRLLEWYDVEETSLVVCTRHVILVDAQITELKTDYLAGSFDSVAAAPYAMIIEGQQFVAPPV